MPRIAKPKIVKEKVAHGEGTEGKVLRNWCFTINNWEKPEYKTPEGLTTKEAIAASVTSGLIRCVIYGEEIAKTGTPHLQGYVEFTKGVRTGQACKALGGHASMIIALGDREQNRKYCSKGEADWDHTPGADNSKVVPVNPKVTLLGKWEGGGQGARTDLHDIMERIDKKEKVIETMRAMPEVYARNIRFVEAYRAAAEKESTRGFRKVTTSVFWGDAGTGKTRKAVELAEAAGKRYFFVNSDFGNFPFHGYDGEEVIIFDDFYGSHVSYAFFLRLLDGYQVQLNVKGGSRYSAWDTVYITSNVEPSQFYVNKGLTDALARRIHVTEHFVKKRSEVFCSEVAGVIMDPATQLTEEEEKNLGTILDCLSDSVCENAPESPAQEVEVKITQPEAKNFVINDEIQEDFAYFADISDEISEDNIASDDDSDIIEFIAQTEN